MTRCFSILAKSAVYEELVYETFDDGWPGYEEAFTVEQ